MRKTNIVYEEEIFYIEERLFSKEWLYEEYIIKERKALELSKEMGVDKNLFFQICKFYGISKQEDLKIRRTEDGFVIKKGNQFSIFTRILSHAHSRRDPRIF